MSAQTIKRVSCVVTVVIVAVGTMAWLATSVFSFSYFSACRTCGRIRHSRDLQLPFSTLSYWSQHSIKETPVSSVADKIVGDHDHKWLFGHGSGNGITCAIGYADQLPSTVNSESVASLIENTRRFDGDAEAQKWLNRAMSPETEDFFRSWFRDYPKERMLNADEHEKRLTQAEENWNFFTRHSLRKSKRSQESEKVE